MPRDDLPCHSKRGLSDGKDVGEAVGELQSREAR